VYEVRDSTQAETDYLTRTQPRRIGRERTVLAAGIPYNDEATKGTEEVVCLRSQRPTHGINDEVDAIPSDEVADAL
jgi:hypothetical protein